MTFAVGALFDGEGNPVDAARHPQMELRTRLPVPAPKHSFLRKRRAEALSGHGVG